MDNRVYQCAFCKANYTLHSVFGFFKNPVATSHSDICRLCIEKEFGLNSSKNLHVSPSESELSIELIGGSFCITDKDGNSFTLKYPDYHKPFKAPFPFATTEDWLALQPLKDKE